MVGKMAKTDLALCLLKAQPHRLDLLMRANKRALAMVTRTARDSTQAEAICHMLPKPTAMDWMRKYAQAAANAAACLLVLVLVRVGFTSSVSRFQRNSEQAVRQLYQQHLGGDGLEDLDLP